MSRRNGAGRAARVRVAAVMPAAAVMLAVVVFGLALLAGGSSSALAQTSKFPDVSRSLPSYDAIGFLSSAGVISGYEDGTFGPGDTLKRGQATKMLVLWKGVPLITGASSFPDLDGTYCSYVETACDQGWITGFPDGRFKPYSTLTRQQMAIIMVRAMGWEEMALALSAARVDEILSKFSDRADIAEVALPYVAMAVSGGLFGGYDGRFAPGEGITRGQFCLVVYRAEASMRAVITGVRSSSDYDNKTRVVFDLSRAPGSVTATASPDGFLCIDYTSGLADGSLSRTIGSTEVVSVGAAQWKYDPRTVRITLDLGRYRTFRVMSLEPSEGYGHRIVVDVFRCPERLTGDGPPLICIDPGHGGSDSGAVGVSGTKEKDVNLAISLLVAANLRRAGLRVMMTRETDVAVDLHERAAMANAAGAGIFVSVHNNASGDGGDGPNGTETFYPGTPETYCPEGRLLAEAIQRNLVEALGSADRGARTHWNRLVVLSETEMTAALV
ncbi:MAG: N-acetylmuramoyl-L-alanine amidase, partial [Actinomycetia bacterium]|nr:N-acetylmuramoyl-L-alanine amidase [Actinomycetes bacterium]